MKQTKELIFDLLGLRLGHGDHRAVVTTVGLCLVFYSCLLLRLSLLPCLFLILPHSALSQSSLRPVVVLSKPCVFVVRLRLVSFILTGKADRLNLARK